MKQNKEIAVYTAIFGKYDNLKEPLHPQIKEDADFYCFTDNYALQSETYRIINVEPRFSDPRKNARHFKIAGDPLLHQYKYIIWCDGAVQIIAKSLRNVLDILGEHDIGIFRHPDRICAYEESKVCMERGLDDPATIYQQMAGYSKEGFPRKFGLLESSAYVKRVNPLTDKLARLWWEELHTKSIRDQLSFDYLRWKLGLEVVYFEGTFKTSAFFRSRGHSGKKKRASPKGFMNKINNRIRQAYETQKIRFYKKKIDQLASEH